MLKQIFPQVVREVCGQSSGPEESASPVSPRKTDLDKVRAGENVWVRCFTARSVCRPATEQR